MSSDQEQPLTALMPSELTPADPLDPSDPSDTLDPLDTSDTLDTSDPLDLALDPDTANSWLLVSPDLRRVTVSDRYQNYPQNPQRFNAELQVLSRAALTGRHGFDVDWMSTDNRATVGVALAYESVPRKGAGRAAFGRNRASWFFAAEGDVLTAWHGGEKWTYDVPEDGYERVRVRLDHAGGVLSFFLLTETGPSHVHTFRTEFTEALYPGLCARSTASYAGFC